MSLRSFRKRPPFPFVARASAENLPCLPCIKARGTNPMYYPEFFMFPGPLTVGDPGDNTLDDLIGRTYAFLFCDDFTWYVLRWVGSDDVVPGIGSVGWEVITDLLPPLAELTGNERRFSAAFDQAARLNVAYELDQTVYVTRWDQTLGAYLQNVEFAAVDPVLVFDASWAYHVPTSDVLLFYLTTDRHRLMARVQRDAYAIEYEVWDYQQAVVLDRVTRLPLRYQALAGTNVGTPLSDGARVGVLSDLYPYRPADVGDMAASYLLGAHEFAAYRRTPVDPFSLVASLENAAYTSAVLTRAVTEQPVTVAAAVTDAFIAVAKYTVEDAEAAGLTSVVAEAGYGFATYRVTPTPATTTLLADWLGGTYEPED